MSCVVSVKVPKEVKRKMDELRGEVNWPEEIRKFILSKIEEIERKRSVERALELLKDVREAPEGTAARIVREDRDGN